MTQHTAQPTKTDPKQTALGFLIIFGIVYGAVWGCQQLFGSNSRHISAATWTAGEYPLTADGYLECESPGAIIFKANGKIYGINGTGQGKYKAIAAPLEEIWKPNPAIPGSRIPIADVISEGQKLCK